MLDEIVLNKIQDVLGPNYRVYSNDNFINRFVDIESETYRWQAFEENKDIIPVVFKMVSASRAVVPYISYNTNYDISFWCPLDNVKTDAFGVPLESTVDYYADMERLRSALTNQIVQFTPNTEVDGIITKYGIKGVLTMSEPVRANMYDRTGANKRLTITLSGLINLTDKGVFGADRSIEIGIVENDEEVFHKLDFLTSKLLGNDRDGTSTQKDLSYVPNIDVESNAVTLSFTVDNQNDNKVIKYFEDIAMGATSSLQKFYNNFKFYRNGEVIAEWKGAISCTINNTGGSFSREVISVEVQRKE